MRKKYVTSPNVLIDVLCMDGHGFNGHSNQTTRVTRKSLRDGKWKTTVKRKRQKDKGLNENLKPWGITFPCEQRIIKLMCL